MTRENGEMAGENTERGQKDEEPPRHEEGELVNSFLISEGLGIILRNKKSVLLLF